MHWLACCACCCVGVARITASTPGCCRLSVRVWGLPWGVLKPFATPSGPAGCLDPLRALLGAGGIAAGERHHLDAGNRRAGLQVPLAKGALSGDTDLHDVCLLQRASGSGG